MLQKRICICFLFAFSYSAFSQIYSPQSKGNIFLEKSSTSYKERVILPWKYHYIKNISIKESTSKLGTILFWRSEGIKVKNATSTFYPYISFNIYHYSSTMLNTCIYKAAEINNNTSICDSINKGGNIYQLGNFILFNDTTCVNCSANGIVDYCRNIIQQILSEIENTQTEKWEEILKQLPIYPQKNKKLAISLGL